HVPSTLGGSTVGIRMTAAWLGPDHPEGSHTTSSEQPELMGQLPTTPTRADDQRYIRGHLLNAELGGTNDGHNLFPITAEANSSHRLQIEDRVKGWVNESPYYWAFYQVVVKYKKSHLPPTGTTRPDWQNYINASLNCHAFIRHMDGKTKGEQITVSIDSVYKEAKAKAGDKNDRNKDQRAIDKKRNFSSKGPVEGEKVEQISEVGLDLPRKARGGHNSTAKVPEGIREGLRDAITTDKDKAWVVARFVKEVYGLGNLARDGLMQTDLDGTETFGGEDNIKSELIKLINWYATDEKAKIIRALKAVKDASSG
ncbi:MAG: DNA/RNA non-specific endonuclease, partial [Psychrosphaera sp.]|nr:DNA/RNA non-specific endonuclease [Psychrosphaera sp.]